MILKVFSVLFLFLYILSCSLLRPAGLETYGKIQEISHTQLKGFLDHTFLEWSEQMGQIRTKVGLEKLSKGLVSVGLKVGANLVKFQFDRRYDLFVYKQDTKEKIGTLEGPVSIIQNGSQILLKSRDGEAYLSDTLVFKAKKISSAFQFKGLKYSGELRIFIHNPKAKSAVVKRWKGNLIVVNKIDIEKYLMGVVPSEMPSGRIEVLEALKAQTVAARTYTYAHLGYNSVFGFDVYDDVRDQVYLGQKIYPISNRAVKETSKIILADQKNNIAVSLYHAVCGGETSDIKDVWSTGKKTFSYLKGIKDRKYDGKDYCRGSKYYNWELKWKKEELASILQKSLARWKKKQYKPFKQLKEMRIISKSSSGRVKEIDIKTENRTFRIFGDHIRWVLRDKNGVSLRSTRFRLFYDDGWYTVKGQGFGHGIGLCQVGAMQQSRENRSYRQILSHYYPGTKLIKVK